MRNVIFGFMLELELELELEFYVEDVIKGTERFLGLASK